MECLFVCRSSIFIVLNILYTVDSACSLVFCSFPSVSLTVSENVFNDFKSFLSTLFLCLVNFQMVHSD